MSSPRRILALATLAPLTAHADDKPPTGFFQVGAGYSSDEGFIADARLGQPNLFQSGTGLYLDAQISQLGTKFGLDYVIPRLGDTGLDATFSLLATTRQFPGFERDGEGGAVTLGHRIDRATRIYVRYRIEDVELTPGDGRFAARSTGPLDAHHVLAWAGTGISYNTTDSAIPLRGTRLELLGEASGPELYSDMRLLRLSARADHATDLGPFTLRFHGHATYIHAADAAGVPLSERLFHDGYSDIRGYPIYSIGSPFGENLEALGRAELEVPISRRAGLSLAGFYDVAYRYNEDAAFGPVAGAMFRAAGGSLIWRSPIGPLRFDIAVPLDGKDRERAFLLNIGAGF
jgi:outer membrane protein insertion porin family